MPSPNPRFGALPPYPLAEMKAIRRRIEAEGGDVIDLGAGDAPLDPPPAVVEKLREVASDIMHSRYAFQLGLPAFREAVANFMSERFGVEVDPSRHCSMVPLPTMILESRTASTWRLPSPCSRRILRVWWIQSWPSSSWTKSRRAPPRTT